MALKVILFLASLLFLFGGGLCSIFLMEQNTIWKICGIGMTLLCVYTFLAVLYWLPSPNKNNSLDKAPKAPTRIVIATILVVIVVYTLCWSGLANIRIAG